MNCPKCKNPIEDNALICEWCGVLISNEVQKNTEETTSHLDVELISLLAKGEKEQAINLYKQKTGETSKSVCKAYIERLDFFRTHELATELTWAKQVNKRRAQVAITAVLFFVGFYIILLGGMLSFGWMNTAESDDAIVMIPIGVIIIIFAIIKLIKILKK